MGENGENPTEKGSNLSPLDHIFDPQISVMAVNINYDEEY